MNFTSWSLGDGSKHQKIMIQPSVWSFPVLAQCNAHPAHLGAAADTASLCTGSAQRAQLNYDTYGSKGAFSLSRWSFRALEQPGKATLA